MSNIYFTSDTHFGHPNIVGPNVSRWKSGYRTFDSLHEMNKTLINNINKTVQWDDTLYHLGDWSFRESPKKYRDQINCRNIHIITGNHDSISRLEGNFSSIQSEKFLKIDDILIFMHHYAHRVWPSSHHGSFHLYGHSHGSISNDWGRSTDVGVDMAYKLLEEYRPFSWAEVKQILLPRPIKVVDHHHHKKIEV